MIAKILIPILLVVFLTHLYFDLTFLRRLRRWKRLLCWLVPVAASGYVLSMAFLPNYFPRSVTLLSVFMAFLVCGVVPLALIALFSCLARWLKRRFFAFVGWGLAVVVIVVYAYGSLVGFYEFEVRRVEIAFDDLPPAFDGYRIVQFSDVHLGTLTGRRHAILERLVDSINAQKADIVVFTGDLQNMHPDEIVPDTALLSRLEATDGVCSVLGNHDGSFYVDGDYVDKAINEERTIGLQQDMGWRVLVNSRRYLYRGQDSIVMAGMANDGEGRFPANGNINNALWNVNRNQFVVMLEHDPTSWRRKILRSSHTQLTLSGHTHSAQFSLFGWSPAAFRYREYDGLYEIAGRYLFVSKGVGGVIPFRFGAKGEIVVITLRSKQSSPKS